MSVEILSSLRRTVMHLPRAYPGLWAIVFLLVVALIISQGK